MDSIATARNDRTLADGEALHAFIAELFPLCRSITGPGLRETLLRIGRRIPLSIHEVPSGTPVLDWTVPDEWTIRGAWIETLDGRRIVDFADCNLHVVGYSRPVDAVLTKAELAKHVHTLPDTPELVAYHTAFYADTWAFSLSHRQWQAMTEERYRVVIDSTLAPGALTYGELTLPGASAETVLIHAHVCHPSLANDNLSGIALATALAQRMAAHPRRLTYRFVFVPATIGAITWLARNADKVKDIRHGLVLSCLGDPGPFHYKLSVHGDGVIDRAVVKVCKDRGLPLTIRPFKPTGYDERQYSAPAYELAVGCFTRSPDRGFPAYHTSADNLDIVTPAALDESLGVLTDVLDLLDANVTWRRVDGRGEPQLGRRGLYRLMSAQAYAPSQDALLWVLNQANGRRSLLDIAERSGLPFTDLRRAADIARAADLLVPVA